MLANWCSAISWNFPRLSVPTKKLANLWPDSHAAKNLVKFHDFVVLTIIKCASRQPISCNGVISILTLMIDIKTCCSILKLENLSYLLIVQFQPSLRSYIIKIAKYLTFWKCNYIDNWMKLDRIQNISSWFESTIQTFY